MMTSTEDYYESTWVSSVTVPTDLYEKVFFSVAGVFLFLVVTCHTVLGWLAIRKRLNLPKQELSESDFITRLSAGYWAIYYGVWSISAVLFTTLMFFNGIQLYLVYHPVLGDVGHACFLIYILRCIRKGHYVPTIRKKWQHQNEAEIENEIEADENETDDVENDQEEEEEEDSDYKWISYDYLNLMYMVLSVMPFGTSFKILLFIWFTKRFDTNTCELMTPFDSAQPFESKFLFVPHYILAILIIIGLIVSFFALVCQFGHCSIRKSCFRIEIQTVLVAGSLLLVSLWAASVFKMAAILDREESTFGLAVPSIMLFWIPLAILANAQLYYTLKCGYFLLMLPEWGHVWTVLLGSLGVVYSLDTGRKPCDTIKVFTVVYTVFSVLCFVIFVRMAVKNQITLFNFISHHMHVHHYVRVNGTPSRCTPDGVELSAGTAANSKASGLLLVENTTNQSISASSLADDASNENTSAHLLAEQPANEQSSGRSLDKNVDCKNVSPRRSTGEINVVNEKANFQTTVDVELNGLGTEDTARTDSITRNQDYTSDNQNVVVSFKKEVLCA